MVGIIAKINLESILIDLKWLMVRINRYIVLMPQWKLKSTSNFPCDYNTYAIEESGHGSELNI